MVRSVRRMEGAPAAIACHRRAVYHGCLPGHRVVPPAQALGTKAMTARPSKYHWCGRPGTRLDQTPRQPGASSGFRSDREAGTGRPPWRRGVRRVPAQTQGGVVKRNPVSPRTIQGALTVAPGHSPLFLNPHSRHSPGRVVSGKASSVTMVGRLSTIWSQRSLNSRE